MSALRHLQFVLAASLVLGGQSGCAANSASAQPDLTELFYARATSLFRNPSLASESDLWRAQTGERSEGARLTILRDFRIQTQIQIAQVSDENNKAVELQARFATPFFGVEAREMEDGSTLASATVDSYFIEISAQEYESTMEQLRGLAAVPTEPLAKKDDSMVCLHEAAVYFESIEHDKSVLFSRGACDADFRDAILPSKPILDLAMRKLPSAEEKFDFAFSLFDEIAKDTTEGDE